MLRGLYWLNVTIIYNVLRTLFDYIGLSCISNHVYELWMAFDQMMANFGTAIFDRNLERRATAPMTILSDAFVYPDNSLQSSNASERITAVTPIETWLTDESIDYSIFFDYYIDADRAKQALSRVLSKTPIIGGVWRQINDHQIGIEYRRPRIPFIHAQSNLAPSTDANDADKTNYYTKYTNGANKRMPFPEGKHVFKITLTHYPKAAAAAGPADAWHTLIAVGCSHALCDAEALFTLLRGWASEYRGVGDEYRAPEFSRHRLMVPPETLETFDDDAVVLGKHFGRTLQRNAWFFLSLWPVRRWRPRTWIWSKPQINALKQTALNGRAGAQLKAIGRLSGNDVLLALYWKLNATLNNAYEMHRPILCTMVINTRQWIPDRFPSASTYFGNALAFLVLHEQRGKLIAMDFSEIVLRIRQTVMSLKAKHFEQDLHFYTHWLAQNPIRYRQCFQGKWNVRGDADGYGGYWHSYYVHDRDMMVSNLMKLNTHEMDMGQGHPSRVRFNHRDEPTMMTYIFKYPSADKTVGERYEFYGAFPKAYDAFFAEYDIQNAKLDWDDIKAKYVSAPKWRPFFREYPWMRCFRVHPKRDCCSTRKDKKANLGPIEI